ncbi:MAG: ABC transporter ATP-binding protein [Bacillaceae bacterium]|nr:ABC transporter ATP-binding protein [Bacillaceae bacterium]
MLSTQPMLQVEDLQVYYDQIQALAGVSLEVHEGEVVALLGANGAGKTTLLHTVSGLISPRKGKVTFKGEEITRYQPEKIVTLGIGHVPEHRQIFGTLSVKDNLILGAYHHYKKTGKNKVDEEIEKMYELFPILKERESQLAGTLSGGQQQMLAIARALMTNPKLLLLDEPSLGLAPIIVKEVLELIRRLRDELGTTVLLIEQNVFASLKISDRAYVIQRGEIVKQGSSRELLDDEEVREAYLGHKAV